MNARAVCFAAPRSVELVDVQVPQPRDGQVVVRTRFSGISSGTEMLAYRGEVDPSLPLDETLGALSGTFAYPFSFGYSCVGTVEESRASVREGALVFAFHPHQDLFVVDASDTVVLADLEPRVGTLLPLVETALQVCLDTGTRYSEVVVVSGLGPVGLLVAMLMERAGAEVVGSEPVPWRREAASSSGVKAVSPQELPGVVEEKSRGRGADLLIEASGEPGALASGLELLAHEGTALVCSWYGTKPVPLPLGADFHRRRLSIRSTQVSTIAAPLTARWDRERRREVVGSLLRELPLSLLATHEYPFERAAEAYEAIDRGEEGLVHVTLRYG